MTLRSSEGIYRSLLLFRLAAKDGPSSQSRDFLSDESVSYLAEQIYVMESACPHLGADMSHADIEECETGLVAVCPWHR